MSEPVTAHGVLIHGIAASDPVVTQGQRSGTLNLLIRDLGPIEKRLREKGDGQKLQRMVIWDETDDDSGVIANLADAYERLRKEWNEMAAEVESLKEQMRAARQNAQDTVSNLYLPGEP